MILVDKDIEKRILDKKLIECNFSRELLNCISYDLTIDEIIAGETVEKYTLQPNEVVFVKTKEKLNMPHDLMGIVSEKNSRMRQGLRVEAPKYFPGHSTYMFLRVENISPKLITLEQGMRIAQIMFSTLSSDPKIPYDRQWDASFNNEEKYKGLGKYKKEYDSQISSIDDKVEKAKNDIDNMSHKIYSNVLTLMGVAVAIFSLITINYEAFSKAEISLKYIIAMNLSLGFCITLLLGLVFLFLNTNRKKSKHMYIVYLAVFIILAVAVVCFCIATF